MAWLVGALLLLSLNLRSHLAALAPLLDDIRADLGLTAAAAGLVTTLPILCFAVGSAVVPRVAARLGTDRTVLVSLAVISVAAAVRPWGGTALLLGGTVVLGLAITVGNVLVPVVTARDFPGRVPTMTSVASATFTGGAALAAALAVPIAAVVGWRAGSAAWAVLGLLGLAAWWWVHPGPGPAPAPRAAPSGSLARSGTVWALAGYFGLQSALYYGVTTWLPTYLREAGGMTPEAAGVAMSVYQLVGIAGALLTPIAVRARRGTPGLVGSAAGAVWLLALGALLLDPAHGLWWGALAGISQGIGFTTALLLIAAHGREVASPSALSALVQGVGYVIGAGGPFLVGAVYGAAGWGWALTVLVAAAAGLVVLGPLAARPLGRSPRPAVPGVVS